MSSKSDQDNFDNHHNVGFVHVIFRLIKSAPELRWAYFFLVLGCLAAGKLGRRIAPAWLSLCSYHSPTRRRRQQTGPFSSIQAGLE